MQRLINNLVYLSWIGKLVKVGQLTSAQARFLEGAVYTFEFGVLTFLFNALDTGNRTNRKATWIVLTTGFIKTIIEGVMLVIRTKMKQKQEILEAVNLETPQEQI